MTIKTEQKQATHVQNTQKRTLDKATKQARKETTQHKQHKQRSTHNNKQTDQ